MRVLRLRVSAFGPHATSRLLDVREAERPVLVHGPPGSGKRSLVDAIGFALFGLEEGPERHGMPLRSAEAAASRSTEVELEFEHGGRVYRVRRRPPRPGRTPAGEASFWDRTGIDDESDEGDVLARGGADVTDEIARRLGLPGEVLRRALCVTTAEAEGALEGPGALASYLDAGLLDEAPRRFEEELEGVVLAIEESVDALHLRRARALERVAEALGVGGAGWTLDELAERRRSQERRLELLEAELEQQERGLAELQGLLATAEERADRLQAIEEAREVVRALEAKEPERRALQRELERAERARAMEPREASLSDPDSLRELERATRALRRAEAGEEKAAEADAVARAGLELARARQEELDEARGELARLEEQAATWRVLESTRTALEETEKQRGRAQADHDAAEAEVTHVAERVRAARAARAEAAREVGRGDARRMAGLRSALAQAEALVDLARKLGEAQRERRDITKLHATTKIHLDRSRQDMARAERDLEHARSSGVSEQPILERMAGLRSDLERLRGDERDQLTVVTELGERVLELRQHMGGDAYTEREQLEERAARARAELEDAGSSAQRLAELDDELASLQGRERETAERLEAARSELHAVTARRESESALAAELAERLPRELHREGALERRRADVTATVDRMVRDADRARLAAGDAAEELDRRRAATARCRERHARAAEAAEAAHGELRAACREAGFADVTDFQAAKRTAKERRSLERRVDELDRELKAGRARLAELQDGVEVPVLRERDKEQLEEEEWQRRQEERRSRLQEERVHRDRALLESLLDQIRSLGADTRSERDQIAAAAEKVREHSRRVDELTAELGELGRRHGIATRLADLAAGRTGGGVRFVDEVRAGLHDEAVLRASRWLRELSGERWALSVPPVPRDEEVPLEVVEVAGTRRWPLPALTGTRRLACTLALGLARSETLALAHGAAALDTVVIEGLSSGDPGVAAGLAELVARIAGAGPAVVVLGDVEQAPAGWEGFAALGLDARTPAAGGRAAASS